MTDVDINNPTPGGDFGTWGVKLNVVTETLADAIEEVATDAEDAQTAAETAVASAATAASAAGAAQSAATAASSAAASAASVATGAASAVSQHAGATDPHPQYLTPARADLRYTRLAGVPQAGNPPEPLYVAQGSATGVSLSLAFSPFGVNSEGVAYYDAAGVAASDRAVPVIGVDGAVKFVKIGSTGSTSDLTPPTLSAITATSITSASAVVGCTADEVVSVVVQYGTTTSYGSTASSVGNGASLTVSIGGLTAATTYNYRVRATDLAGNVTTSSNFTFTTAAAGAAPQTAADYTSATLLNWSYQMMGADASGADHWVEADVSGLTNSNRNAGFVLRGNSGATAGIVLILSGTQYKIEHLNPSTNILAPVAWNGAGSGAGKMRAEVIGTTVVIYWNGSLVASHDLGSAISAYSANRRAGVGIYQDTSGAVAIRNIKSSASSATTPPPPQNPGDNPPTPGTPGAKAVAMLGPTRSGLPWHSGVWIGGAMSTANANGFGTWRGSATDLYTVYPAYASWAEMDGSNWVTELMSGFQGRLNYGLPLLPRDRAGAWNDVLSGAHDYTFTNIATNLKNANRGDSVIRVALECNGNWFPWSVTWGTDSQFKQAFQRVVNLFRAVSPNFKFAYCWNIYTLPQGMPGGTSQVAQLDRFYPGDSYVDLIELDFYDFYNVVAQNESQWAYAKNPVPGVGLDVITAYARSHGKGVWIGEWGGHSVYGPGDNPFFIRKVWEYFVSIADVLVGENYFNEPDAYIANGIGWPSNQLPNAAIAYKNRWGRPDLYPTGATP